MDKYAVLKLDLKINWQAKSEDTIFMEKKSGNMICHLNDKIDKSHLN